ncbi:hypothetical protein PR003_g15041 [Phytophthora rubi]|uniref:Uncharacterized protein n=1 Tax=Phytophthora rubi TaxID=129364 RepID=A0A6A3KXR0_9STRA|nr:hypothetical protein PR002_g15020 [Phytophthora rubi]KAE9018810.1 hypothetical protein PR001_g14035 [Phytophthora rubi]KAE9331361.1 hypothetical protein PR003_g15041 [Phytophthora rubi]
MTLPPLIRFMRMERVTLMLDAEDEKYHARNGPVRPGGGADRNQTFGPPHSKGRSSSTAAANVSQPSSQLRRREVQPNGRKSGKSKGLISPPTFEQFKRDREQNRFTALADSDSGYSVSGSDSEGDKAPCAYKACPAGNGDRNEPTDGTLFLLLTNPTKELLGVDRQAGLAQADWGADSKQHSALPLTTPDRPMTEGANDDEDMCSDT